MATIDRLIDAHEVRAGIERAREGLVRLETSLLAMLREGYTTAFHEREDDARAARRNVDAALDELFLRVDELKSHTSSDAALEAQAANHEDRGEAG